MSITRYLTEGSWPGEVYFLYTCRTPADYIFADKMPSLERANPKLHVSVTISRPEGSNWTGVRGRMTKEWLTQTVPNLASRRVHLCGPVPMMDSAKLLLAELGLTADHLKTEAFGLVKPAPTIPGTAPRLIGPATGPRVTFSQNDKAAKIHMDLQTGDSPPRQTILELSEELGIGIEFSCRVGTCGICKVKMTSGEVDMEVQDALDADDKSKGIILACQAKPKADVTVEA
jgi:ferredoxin-NADP reductase